MSSGKYSALSGMTTRLEQLDAIADNLANLKTTGFKKSGLIFAAALDQATSDQRGKGVNFARAEGGYTDFAQGTLNRTGVPLHLGVDGDGFYKVRDAGGNILFTRQGNMRLDPQGFLLIGHGQQVLGEGDAPIQLTDPVPTVTPDGTMVQADGDTRKLVLHKFADTRQLERIGGGLFRAPAGVIPEPVAAPNIQQGNLEESNVNVMQETGRMMEALRVFEACQKMMQTYSTIGSKLDELGSVG